MQDIWIGICSMDTYLVVLMQNVLYFFCILPWFIEFCEIGNIHLAKSIEFSENYTKLATKAYRKKAK